MSNRFAFPLYIQLPYMEPSAANPDFVDLLRLLQTQGFSGVELNLDNFDDPDALRRLLARHDLQLSMVASGAYAMRHGLSLSACDEAVREASVAAVTAMLAFAAALQAGVICGFMKGGAKQDANAATQQMEKSLQALSNANAPLYIEATNHYEATLANTLDEGAALIAGKGANLRILPDTYHMNIEEQSTMAALLRHKALYANLHLSDNNRYFPGFGAIDFRALCRALHADGYTGTMAVEGRTFRTLKADIVDCARYLESCTEGLGR